MFGRREISPPPPVPSSVAAKPAPRSPSERLKPVPVKPAGRRVRAPRGGLLFSLSALLSFLVVIAGTFVFGLLAIEREVERPGPLPADKVVFIPRNTGKSEISDLLLREGVIDNPTLFELYAYFSSRKGQLKAGEFMFKAHTSIDGAVETLINGKAILHSITIPEGLTSEQIVARLRENEILVGDINETPIEGSLMPDTYKFDRGTSRQQLVNLMRASARDALNKVWARRAPDLPIKTPQELLILASIVEKETGKADERPRVASVFLNRLQRRMKLQSDPTIVYGLVGGKGTLGRGILRSEIERATPYNTYAIEGLPPGPIANPGRAALEAVANPLKTKDLYFVADGTGGHVFAETLDQHNKNVARWREIEKARAASEDDADRPEPPRQNRTDIDSVPSEFRAATAFADSSEGARGRGFDASEGTSRDPLNDDWDPTSPKTVPSIGSRPEPLAAVRPTAKKPAAPQAPRREVEARPPGPDASTR